MAGPHVVHMQTLADPASSPPPSPRTAAEQKVSGSRKGDLGPVAPAFIRVTLGLQWRRLGSAVGPRGEPAGVGSDYRFLFNPRKVDTTRRLRSSCVQAPPTWNVPRIIRSFFFFFFSACLELERIFFFFFFLGW